MSDGIKITKRSLAKRLREAAERIEKYGHKKRGLGTKATGYCAIGAIVPEKERTDGDGAYRNPFVAAAAKAMIAAGVINGVSSNRYLGDSLYLWNDAPHRKADEVITGFRTVAARLEHGLQVDLNV